MWLLCNNLDVITGIILDLLMRTQTIKFDVEDIGSVEIDVSEKTIEKVTEYFKQLPHNSKWSCDYSLQIIVIL